MYSSFELPADKISKYCGKAADTNEFSIIRDLGKRYVKHAIRPGNYGLTATATEVFSTRIPFKPTFSIM
jgi:hypothetical protein